jgi:ChrR Cupin-like domain
MKLEREFFPVGDVAWTAVAGDVHGLTERLLSVDREAEVATRILAFAPGTDTTPNGVQAHDFYEEVYILSGSIHDLTLDKTFETGEYACRPPGMEHGPWFSEDGCTVFEVRYRADDE